MPLTDRTSVRSVVEQIVSRSEISRATEAIIHSIDADRVDIRLRNSSGIIRHVRVLGDIGDLQIGQDVAIRWRDNRPEVMVANAASGIATASGGGFYPLDNRTIESSPYGLRVKTGGIGLQHLNFEPAMKNHVHRDDPFSMGGWQVTESGAIFNGTTFIYPSGQISLGSDENVVKLDSLDDEYRLWAGAIDPADATFKVSISGELFATAGEIAGWDIEEDKLTKNDIDLDPSGQITVGSGDDVAVLSSIDEDDFRLWIGAADPNSAPFRVTKSGEVWLDDAHFAAILESTNYASGISGWHIDSSGWAEFNDVTVRGGIIGATFKTEEISVIAGRQRIADGTNIAVDALSTDTTLVFQDPVFEENDILYVKPSSTTKEWIRVTGDYTVTADGYSYPVERGADGEPAYDLYAGMSVHCTGAASWPDPMPLFGEMQFGEGVFGGSGTAALGGFLTLEGSRQYGPYFGVARRFGAHPYQISDVARFGMLRGFLGVTDTEYGVAIGDASRYLLYSYVSGLKLQTDDGKLIIDDDGLQVDRVTFDGRDDAPEYWDGKVVLWSDSAGSLKTRMKNGDTEVEKTLTAVLDTLTENRTYYVRADGDDDNDGLTNDAEGAFLTIQHAVDIVSSLNIAGYQVTIQVGAGTYNEAVQLKNVFGFDAVSAATGGDDLLLIGDETTPSNVVISTSTSNAITARGITTVWAVSGFKVEADAGYGVATASGSVLNIRDLEFGACYYGHIGAFARSNIYLANDFSISGDAWVFIQCEDQSYVSSGSGSTVTFLDDITFSNFVQVSGLGMVRILSTYTTFDVGSYTIVGTRYWAYTNSVIDTAGGGATYFPGDAFGSATAGAQYV